MLKSHYFKIKAAELSQIFEPDKINQGYSILKLKRLGKIQGLEKLLKTNFEKGLFVEKTDIKNRIKVFGDNQPIIRKNKSLWELINKNLEDKMIGVLIATAILSLTLGIITEGLATGWLEGSSILFAVILVVGVTVGNDYIKQLEFQKLNPVQINKNVQAFRNGRNVQISIYQILVGDIVEIAAGDKMFFDGILIKGDEISVDEAEITGQTTEVKKRVPTTYERDEDANPFILSTSLIMRGKGVMVVMAVGKMSYYGRLKTEIHQELQQSPLQKRLVDLSNEMSNVGFVSGIVTFSAIMLHHLYTCWLGDSFLDQLYSMHTVHQFIQAILITFTIDIALPEGLPLSITMALSYGETKMKESNLFVRYLQVCETMGGVHSLCFSKTGVITKNLLSVTKVYVEENFSTIISTEIMSKKTCRLLCLAIVNNTLACPKIIDENESARIIVQSGNKVQSAMLEMAYLMGYNYENFRQKDQIKRMFSDNFQKRRMATIYRDEKENILVFLKGSPSYLLPLCNRYINKFEEISHIDGTANSKILNALSKFTERSLRPICIAYKEVNKMPRNWKEAQQNLVLIAILGISDPLREGIPQAIKAIKSAGVQIKLVTGESKQTSIAIAKEAGILDQSWTPKNDDFHVMEGREFRRLIGEADSLMTPALVPRKSSGEGRIEKFDIFQKISTNLCVLSNASSKDKLQLVAGLRRMNQVVAMVGSGTNDVSSLKRAHVGFAMGISSTEMAKEASGIMLVNDNFESILQSIKWGRNIFDSIRKLLLLQLTVNVVASIMALLGAMLLGESPLSPLQMLWINLILDAFGSYAMITEEPSSEILKQKPYAKRQHLLTSQMIHFIIVQGLYQVIVLSFILFSIPEIFSIPYSSNSEWNIDTGKHYSIFFHSFVMLQIFNEFNARELDNTKLNVFKNIFKNQYFSLIFLGSLTLEIVLMRVGGSWLKVVELSYSESLFCFLIGSTSLYAHMVLKIILPSNILIGRKGIQFGNWKYYWKKEEDIFLDFEDNQSSVS